MTAIAIQPKTAQVSIKGSVQFHATVTGAGDTAVTWSVAEGANGGGVSALGLYTAPSAPGMYHVVAASHAAPSLTDTATVSVTLPPGTPPNLTIGTWTNISPTVLPFTNVFADLVTSNGAPGLLAAGIAIDPSNPLTLYECIDSFATPTNGGIWKSTDGGTSWAHLGNLDYPVEVAVDPGNSKHLYATDGVSGTTPGFWVSNDAGKTWTQPSGFTTAAALPSVKTADSYSMAADPSDFNHVLLGFHSGWNGTENAGILESPDGGSTWVVHNPPAAASGLGYYVEFLYDPPLGLGNKNTWLLGTQSGGYFKTTDAGTTWKQVTAFNMAHEGMHTYYANNGTLYAGAQGAPMRSTDNGSTWTQLNVTGGGTWVGYFTTVFGDGTNLYANPNGFGKNVGAPYYTSPATDGTTWKVLGGGTPAFLSGPMQMAFDPANHILYASMFEVGVWALKVQ
jgi:photosystem II stability/assembly factor-like uncharacterized protein